MARVSDYRRLIEQVDEAGLEAEFNPAVRATVRLQDECHDPDVTFRVVDSITVPTDAVTELVTEHRWPNGEPIVVRRYWPKGDAQS